MAQSVIAQYTSEFRHTLDDKNRLTIPSGWRAGHDETDTFVATPHPDGYIAVLPPIEVANLKVKASQKSLTDSGAQNALARFFAASYSLTFDKQGRISLPDQLRRHAAIDKDAVLVGVLTKFNIYNPAQWDKLNQGNPGENLGDVMRSLGI